LRKEDKVRYGPRISLAEAMLEGAMETFGVPADSLTRHHVIPRSARGLTIRLGGIDYSPSGKDIRRQTNQVPLPNSYHGLGHLMCEMVLRANGYFDLAREHRHSARALLARTETEQEWVNVFVLGVVSGVIINRNFGVPGERRNWGGRNVQA
jgi:hypothetical protein